jgi:hypothetical protein
MRWWRRFPAPVTALAPILLISIPLTVVMFVTEDARVVIAGGVGAALVVFYLLRRVLLRRSTRLDPVAGSRVATGDTPKVAGHSWPMNRPRPVAWDRDQERMR